MSNKQKLQSNDKDKKKRKKGKELYVDHIKARSRNQTNVLSKDKKNLTVGKVLNKDTVSRQNISVGALASVLKSQFNVKKLGEEEDSLF